VRFFKYLDYDQMVGSRIMSKFMNISKMLFRPSILCLLDGWAKSIQNT